MKAFFEENPPLLKLLISAIILILAHTIHRIIIRSLRRIIKKSEQTHKKQTLISVVSSIIKFVIYFVALMIVLETFGVKTSSIVTIAGVGSVAVGLGAQTLVKDVVSGLFILVENQYNIGDFIEVVDYSGTVEALSLRTTILRTVEGEVCYIPNGEIRGVKNYSKDYMNALVEVMIPFQVDVEHTMQVIDKWLETYFIEHQMIEPLKLLGITEITDRFYRLRMIGKTTAGTKWAVERQVRKDLMLLFKKEGIPLHTNIMNIKNVTP